MPAAYMAMRKQSMAVMYANSVHNHVRSVALVQCRRVNGGT